MLAGCAGKRAKAPPVIAKPPVEEAPTTPADQRLRDAIRYYMGTDYKYGGTSKEGLDCSGFVMTAYESAGIKMPRSSELQYQHGKKVSPEDLRYGDLVFFNNYCYSKYSYATASILSGALSQSGATLPCGHLYRRRPLHPFHCQPGRRHRQQYKRRLLETLPHRRPALFAAIDRNLGLI